MMVLRSIRAGTITGTRRTNWVSVIKNAMKSTRNPLDLTADEKRKLTAEIKSLSGKRISAKQPRPSPTASAANRCGMKLRGNDGNMYISKPNKNGVCRWVKA
jgi:hypothetical protein